MSELNITVAGGTTTKLLTAGKYCDKNILITAEGGGGDIPAEAFSITGNKKYWNHQDNWTWFIKEYGSQITTSNLSDMSNMFEYAYTLDKIPFALNCKTGTNVSTYAMFHYCYALKEIGDFNNISFKNVGDMFNGCRSLRYLPNFNNCDWSYQHTDYNAQSGMFQEMYSLRSIPSEVLKEIYSTGSGSYGVFLRNLFAGAYVIDEINGINPQSPTLTSNVFGNSFSQLYRVKNITFAVDTNGNPYTVSWKNQTIALNSAIGWNTNVDSAVTTDYNSGITVDKKVTDAASYAALKDDPDWYTNSASYSRFNHDSAVNLINSLPDTSAYIAANGGTNTIQFHGDAGSLTDGGAINTLTEEEIAVATAKGWTISFS